MNGKTLLPLILSAVMLNGCFGGRQAYLWGAERQFRTGINAPSSPANAEANRDEPEAENPDGGDSTTTMALGGALGPHATDPGSYQLRDMYPGRRPDDHTIEGGLWIDSERTERNLRRSAKRITHPELVHYVDDLVCRIAGPFCPDIRVILVAEASFNAGMYPNGLMLIHSGLLLRITSEAQLATILGHEIGHFIRRHGLSRTQHTIQSARIQTTLEALSLFILNDSALGGLFGGVAGALSNQAYSRDNEREADGYGMALMVEAGFAADEAARTWRRVIQTQEVALPEDYSESELIFWGMFFGSHPFEEEREAMLAALGERFIEERGVGITGRERYIAALSPYVEEFLELELRHGPPEATRKVLELLLEEEIQPMLAHFYLGEWHRLRGLPGDANRALVQYELARKMEGAPPARIHRSLGLIHQRLGDAQSARRSFETYLRLSPEAEDKAVILQILETLG